MRPQHTTGSVTTSFRLARQCFVFNSASPPPHSKSYLHSIPLYAAVAAPQLACPVSSGRGGGNGGTSLSGSDCVEQPHHRALCFKSRLTCCSRPSVVAVVIIIVTPGPLAAGTHTSQRSRRRATFRPSPSVVAVR